MKITDEDINIATGIPIPTLRDWRRKNEEDWRKRIYTYISNSLAVMGTLDTTAAHIAVEIQIRRIETTVISVSDRSLLIYTLSHCSFPIEINNKTKLLLQVDFMDRWEEGLSELKLENRKINRKNMEEVFFNIVAQVDDQELEFLFRHYPRYAHFRNLKKIFESKNQKNWIQKIPFLENFILNKFMKMQEKEKNKLK